MDVGIVTPCCRSACACSSQTVIVGTDLNTLTYDSGLCINCGMCLTVCPHGVFEAGARAVQLARPERCMECGACQRNCPTGAVQVDSGVGCAAAMIRAALTGSKEVTCGSSDAACCS
jgi:NAD-dependent dihydropyrimidine dehydrogenase PreA subunit